MKYCMHSVNVRAMKFGESDCGRGRMTMKPKRETMTSRIIIRIVQKQAQLADTSGTHLRISSGPRYNDAIGPYHQISPKPNTVD